MQGVHNNSVLVSVSKISVCAVFQKTENLNEKDTSLGMFGFSTSALLKIVTDKCSSSTFSTN